MIALDPADVTAASNAWLWYPEDATVVANDDLLLVRWPEHYAALPTLVRFTPTGDMVSALDTARDHVRRWGEPGLTVWVKPGAPSGFEALVRSQGGEPEERLDIFAASLAGVRGLGVPDRLEIRPGTDPRTVRDGVVVTMAAFGNGRMPGADVVAAMTADQAADQAAGRGLSLVGYASGRPVASAGLSIVGPVARLWGGGVVPDQRGRGFYRGILAARIAFAREQGAVIGLVKGRVETSGPVLRRAGFEAFGQERSYRLSLPGSRLVTHRFRS